MKNVKELLKTFEFCCPKCKAKIQSTCFDLSFVDGRMWYDYTACTKCDWSICKPSDLSICEPK
jgi:hypothetical protein